MISVATVILIWVIWQAIQFARSYRLARSIGLPILISPISTENPLWLLTYKVGPAWVMAFLRWLPTGMGMKYSYDGWQFDDRHAIGKSGIYAAANAVAWALLWNLPKLHVLLTSKSDTG